MYKFSTTPFIYILKYINKNRTASYCLLHSYKHTVIPKYHVDLVKWQFTGKIHRIPVVIQLCCKKDSKTWVTSNQHYFEKGRNTTVRHQQWFYLQQSKSLIDPHRPGFQISIHFQSLQNEPSHGLSVSPVRQKYTLELCCDYWRILYDGASLI